VVAVATIAGVARARASGEVIGDLPEFYASGWLVAHGRSSEVYDLPRFFAAERALFPGLEHGVALFSPPPAALLLAPLAAVPVAWAWAAWTALLAAALIASVALLAACFELERVETLCLAGLVLLSGPAIEALRLGQPSPLLLLAVCAIARFCDARGTGAALALALAFKPQHLLPLAVFCAAARWRRLVAAAAVGLVVLGAGAVAVFGARGVAAYVSLVTDPDVRALMQPELNATARGQLLRLVGTGGAATSVIAAALVLAALVVAARLGARHRASGRLDAYLAVGLPLALVTSLHCHDYDLVLLVPGLVALARTEAWRCWSPTVKAIFAVGLAPFLLPLYQSIHYGHLIGGGLVNPHFVLLAALSVAVLVAEARDPAAFAIVPRARPGRLRERLVRD
jgi:hypothetical protein